MEESGDLLRRAAEKAVEFRAGLPERPVAQPTDLGTLRDTLGGPLPEGTTPPNMVLDKLIQAADPGLVATAGPRFFGFVVGGSLEVAAAADILATGWDQCAFNAVSSPAAAVVEECAGGWLKDLLGIPATASVGFVTGGQAANTVGLAAARHHLLTGVGWDVEQDGLAGAPAIRVVASEERHATIDRSVRLLGLGLASLRPVAADANGAIDVTALEHALRDDPSAPTVVCLQAGNVNTGACDNLRAACEVAHRHGAWVHVDGAFGLWAAANPATRHLVDGVELADSWACDGHKWLNVPYDAGFAFCSRPDVHAAALSYSAAYLVGSGGATPGMSDFTPESSRRARGFRDLGNAASPRSDRRGRPGGAHLRAGHAVRHRTGRWWRRDRQRRRAQPGPRRLRRRCPHRSRHRGRAIGRDLLDGRHNMARPTPHAHLRVQLVDL